ncbi:SDR family NAD(P)-dependent oxidoreductase (plasmid) [Nocardioides sp. R1-1]|uniref:SDR family NAD(P)-dependent oxidoreductase n=1 Tax=Nocardioides sp. R1-1 TaxID=3383502 RepID=UPI0038D10EA1
MPVRLDDKAIFVTGGANGIGEAVAVACIESGASVVAVDVDVDGLERLAASLDAGERFKPYAADVTDEDAVRKAVDFSRSTYGRIDGCFNNAGVAGVPSPLPDTSREEFNRIMQINVYGFFYVLKHAMGAMREQRSGSIVNTASTAGLGGIGNVSPYVASKHAAVGLTLSAGLEAGYYGVRVNAVCPGWIWTPIQKWVGEEIYNDPIRAAEIQKQLAANVPLQRFAQPEEVARAVTFLLSDESSYIAGETLRIDGAMLSGYMA